MNPGECGVIKTEGSEDEVTMAIPYMVPIAGSVIAHFADPIVYIDDAEAIEERGQVDITCSHGAQGCQGK